jgi:hypothetical protein
MLVTFGNLTDPTSVAQGNPDDPMTTGNEKRLGQLPNDYDKTLDSQSSNNSQELVNHLSQCSFAKGTIG